MKKFEKIIKNRTLKYGDIRITKQDKLSLKNYGEKYFPNFKYVEIYFDYQNGDLFLKGTNDKYSGFKLQKQKNTLLNYISQPSSLRGRLKAGCYKLIKFNDGYIIKDCLIKSKMETKILKK